MIFISYSRKETKQAKLLHERLIARGYQSHQVFRDDDPRNGIGLGEHWESALLENLRGTQVFLVLLSRHWIKSKWCFAELAIAHISVPSPTIIPIALPGTKPKHWSASGLAQLQGCAVDASEALNLRDFFDDFIDHRLTRQHPPDRSLQRSRRSLPGSNLHQYQTIEQWEDDANLLAHQPLVISKQQVEFRNELICAINSQCPHIHVTGSSGTGKTRLIFETLKSQSELSKLAVYYDHPSKAQNPIDAYLTSLVQPDCQLNAIVVVDDCLKGEERILSQFLLAAEARVTLITVSYEESTSSTARKLRLPELDDAEIETLLAAYLPPGSNSQEIAKLCNRSARFAHLVGDCLKSDRQLHLLPSQNELLARMLGFDDGDPSSPDSQTRVTVARFLALFDQVGFESPYQAETLEVVQLVQHFHPSIGVGEITLVVKWLRKRRILQGKATIFFSAKLIQMLLWHQWWEIYGAQFRMDYYQELSDSLKVAFQFAFRSVDASEESRKYARQLLTQPCFSSESMVDDQSRPLRQLLHVLTVHDYSQTIENIAWIHHRCWREVQQSPAPSESVALELHAIVGRIALATHDELAIRLLKQFTIVLPGAIGDYLAGIYAYLLNDERNQLNLVVLRSDLLKGEKYCMLAARISCKAIRITTERVRGTKSVSIASVNSHIDHLWKILLDAARRLQESQFEVPVMKEVGSCLHSLLYADVLDDAKFGDLEWVANASSQSRELLIEELVAIFNFSRISGRSLPEPALRSLMQRLISDSLGLKFFAIGAVEDRNSDEDEPQLLNVDSELARIIDAVVDNPQHIRELLPIGSSMFAKLGTELAKKDKELRVLNELTRRVKEADDSDNNSALAVVCSFNIAQYYEANTVGCHELLEKLASDAKKPSLVLEILARRLPFDTEIQGMANVLISKGADVFLLNYLDANQSTQIEPSLIASWCIKAIEHRTIKGLNTACRLLRDRDDIDKAPVNAAATELILSDFIFSEMRDHKDHLSPTWLQIFKKICALDSQVVVQFAEKFWHAVGQFNFDIVHHFYHENRAIEHLLENYSETVWKVFFSLLNDGESTSGLLRWVAYQDLALNPTIGYWSKIPLHELYAWIDTDMDTRIPEVCFSLPPLVLDGQACPVTREFFLKYYNQHDACRATMASVHPQTWSGSKSDFFNNRIQELNSALSTESDSNVRQWISFQIQRCHDELERTRVKDELSDERSIRSRL